MKKRQLIKLQDAIVGAIAFFCFLLLLSTNTFADSSVVDEVTITVPVSCSLTATVGTAHTATVEVGTYTDDIGETTFKVLCNDSNGFAVYAIGFSDDTYGNTVMKPSSVADTNAIATGTATSGGTSNWAMKLTAVSGDYAPTLATGFNAYHAVPAEYTKVASLGSSTDATVGSSFKSTYAAFISQAQAADTYTGKVKYIIVHPSDAATPITPDAVMQNMDSSECTSTPINVIDNRDDHVYVAQRLADGNCWMMENLDLGRTNLTTDLTSSNTNISTTVSASTFNGWKVTTGTQTTSTGEFIPLDGSDSTTGTNYGTLYNFYAASAGTVSGSVNSGDATYDICPAGWRMPTGGSTGEFSALYGNAAYNTIAKIRAPISENGAAFALAGRFYDAGPTSQASFGYYWSSTRNNDATMKTIRFTTSYFFANDSVGRTSGFAIRCILNEPKTISKLTYLQDFNYLSATDKATVIESMEEKTTYELIDNRDSHAYDVAKLKDGNVWMVENLDLGRTDLSTNLTSANTNTNTTIPAATFNSWRKNSGTHNFNNGEFIPLTTSNTSNGLEIDPTSGTAYGTLYNYYAASAGTIYGTPNTDNAVYDICPAGWRLPTNKPSEGELQYLYNQYSSNATAPVSNSGAAFSLAGEFITSPTDQGVYGYYWSSTQEGGDGDENLTLFVSSSKAVPPFSRSNGFSIRCILKKSN